MVFSELFTLSSPLAQREKWQRVKNPQILRLCGCRVKGVNELLGDVEANTGGEPEELVQLLLREAHEGWDQPVGRVQGAGHGQ